ncbi:tetratricopeptide repeat protein [Longimicrobium terrae]|uniref:Tetratricopeptide (TPR) repeat protein n=1 Tax=Longimicrobium terrae TaxID=1639882 RepID=A0A841H6I5_9BACT|nr:hypothetical protein [Longimicrobium terrae]MBB4639341.1 hypothetical protein [Longimicrobium terrae]MBB6073588.1 tetratricopeptide (TPR) repeat protein [Longimicrobium terrae]NNC29405.1 hypothetical protein [Longimicrobium terrae]
MTIINRTPRRTRALPRALLLLAAAAVPMTDTGVEAQRGRPAPRRPALEAGADTNSAAAYLQLGNQSLHNRPDVALAAFHWAAQLDPGSAEALYGRYAAELVSDPRRLVNYMEGRRQVVNSPAVQRIDSMYFRALTMDPFLYRRHETEVVRVYLRTLARAALEREEGPGGVNDALISHWIDVWLQNAGPTLRAQRAYGDGRFGDALRLYDEALGGRGRKSWLRTERARLYAHIQNDSAAAAEFTLALNDLRGEDERDLVYLYESKALLEYGMGRLHERMGNEAAAREAYGRALAEDLSFYPAHMRMGVMALMAGDTTTMNTELELATEAAAGEPAVGYVHGVALMQAGHLERGAERLAGVTQAAPYFADGWFALGVARERMGDRSAALNAYRAFLARAPRGHARIAVAERLVRELDLSLPAPGAN